MANQIVLSRLTEPAPTDKELSPSALLQAASAPDPDTRYNQWGDKHGQRSSSYLGRIDEFKSA